MSSASANAVKVSPEDHREYNRLVEASLSTLSRKLRGVRNGIQTLEGMRGPEFVSKLADLSKSTTSGLELLELVCEQVTKPTAWNP